jgi:AraC-like DNA-binding protein
MGKADFSSGRPPADTRLDGVIRSLWVSYRSESSFDVVFPTGRAQIVVNIESGRGLVVGPRTVHATVLVPRLAVGAEVTAVGLASLLGGDPDRLVDGNVNLDAVWPVDESLASIDWSDPERSLMQFEDQIARRLAPRLDHRMLAETETMLAVGLRTSEVARMVGLDRRRLVPAFRRASGLGPKQYHDLARFERTLRRIRVDKPPSLSAVAADLGYSDQAHLTRRFRSFAGLAPGALHGRSSRNPNHLLL